jgi:hypothetical protein
LARTVDITLPVCQSIDRLLWNEGIVATEGLRGLILR